jgi:hypothetical protein
MKKFIFSILMLLAVNFICFSQNDLSSDDKKTNNITDASDDGWLKDYITLDPSDDLYYGTNSKRLKIKKSYVENLKYYPKIDFFIDDIDEQNLIKNSNILPWFPYIFMPYGGFSYNRGFDIGFLYRMDNIENTMMTFTAATSFGQKSKFWQHFNMEYPNILKNNRLKLLWTFSIFTTAPQYNSSVSFYDTSNAGLNMFNKIWQKLGLSLNQHNETGFDYITGVDYRIPKIEVNTISLVELLYNYDSDLITNWKTNSDGSPSTPNISNINQPNFSFNLSEELRWVKLKQTSTMPVGNYLSAKIKFYIPTMIGTLSSQFRFKTRVEDKFTYKFFREFAFKTRLIMAANYNISEDFSGDPYVRGYVDKELTGFFALIGNFELLIPMIDVSINEAVNIPLKKDAKFVIFLNLLIDTGFTIDNYNFLLENFAVEKRSPAIYTVQADLGNNYAIIPALSIGGGLSFNPYFLNFIIRLDVSANIIKAAVYNQASIEVIFSFTNMF